MSLAELLHRVLEERRSGRINDAETLRLIESIERGSNPYGSE